MSPDVAASIRARLLNRAKQVHEEFELFLVRYASERFLYRLGASALRERCILKGAGLLTLWMDDPYRATRDLDFLADGPNDAASTRITVATICGEMSRVSRSKVRPSSGQGTPRSGRNRSTKASA